MNRHALTDHLAIGISALLLGRYRYFRESLESATLAEHIQATRLERPSLGQERFHPVTAHTLVGDLDAGIRVAQWRGASYPSVVYHHGTSEKPYDMSFRSVFSTDKLDIPANLIVLRAPYHASMQDFIRGNARLDTYAAMLAVSVRLMEAAVAHCLAQGSPRVMATGISLGGFIANLHRALYGGATLYAPVLAGAAMHAVFFSPAYRKLVARQALEQPERLEAVLDFSEPFVANPDKNVFPLMGRYDQAVDYGPQAAAYEGHPVTMLERGHMDGAVSADLIRAHLLPLLLG